MPYAVTFRYGHLTPKTKIWYRGRFGDLMYKYKPIEGYTPDHLISKYLDNYDYSEQDGGMFG